MGIGVQIKRAMEANGLLAADVAKLLGITESAVSQWFAKDSGPKRDRLPLLASYLKTTVTWLLSDDPWPEPAVGDLAANDTGREPGSYPDGPHGYPMRQPPVQATPTQVIPVQPIPGRPDIPVWSAVAAGDEQGTMIMSDDPIDWISRSDRMRGVKDPFAFYVVGDSMEERFYQGDQAVVNPAMPMRSGSDCVFIRQGDDGQIYGLLKRLMRVAPDVWRVRQLNPRKDFELSRKTWTKAFAIAETRHRA